MKQSLSICFIVLVLLPTTSYADGLKYTLKSPLEGIGSIEGLVVEILNILIVLAVPIIVIMIIFAGFRYVTAQGNEQQVRDASRMLTYALIGGVLIIGAAAVTGMIREAVCSFTDDPTSCLGG